MNDRIARPWLSARHIARMAAAMALFCTPLFSSGVEAQAPLATWKATERWRVDGTEAGDGFGQVRDLVVLRDQSLWVLDYKEQAIWRYSATGAPLGKVSRKGSGPGELRNANGMAVAGDGSVWVNDPSNGRLTVFNSNGSFARQHALPIFGYGYRWGGFYNAATREIIDPTTVRRSDSFALVWRRVDARGADRGTLDVPSCSQSASRTAFSAETPKSGRMSSAYPFTMGGGLAANGQDAMWCANAQSTFAALFTLGGRDTLARTTVAIPPVALSKTERDEAIASIRERVAKYQTTDFDASKVPTQKPGIESLFVDEDGRLWIQHTRNYKSNATVFDVHDAKGVHLGRMTVPVKVAPAMPVKARGMSLWLAVIDEDDLVSIVYYALSK